MAQQKSEDCVVLQDRRKTVQTRGTERLGGGKAVPVNQQARQLRLRFGTAEKEASRDVPPVGEAEPSVLGPATRAEPKPGRTKRWVVSATMEEVVRCLRGAFAKVASNRGAPGPDGRSIAEVREHLDGVLTQLSRHLLDGTYQPGDIRRVWIPKAEGGQRGLGIPNVIDRVVAEAVRQVLEPLYEPTFHRSSHGFRPGRGCHSAIAEAQGYVEDGYEWTVDIDLERFFDRVPHQRLMAHLSERVKDRRILVVVNRMLKAKVVLADGVVVSTEEGVPQGGPLSPLLSNVVLDELDRELDRRGHRFVRYADDCNIYVRSQRAGQRVMASVCRFIEGRLRLKVNRDKSAVARTEERHFVGFRLRREPMDGEVEVLLSERSKRRVDKKIVELTPRNWGDSLRACIDQINAYLIGWIGFFGICTPAGERTFATLDAHIRRRLRAIQLKHWKRKSTVAKRLIQLGVRRRTAWRRVYAGRKSLWALSHDPAVDRGLRNAYFAERGLVSIAEQWRRRQVVAPAPIQLSLALG
jgi:RNA-directed DNA polymerase